MKKIAILILISMGAISCANKNNDNNQPQQQGYSPYGYQIPNSYGCEPQRRQFDSRERYCNGLSDENYNNRCARDWRYQNFQDNCPGYYWQQPGR